MKYDQKRKDRVIALMAGPDRLSIAEISKRENISVPTLYNWRRSARDQGILLPDSDDSPEGWTAADKFNAVLQTASLSEAETAEFCRKNGLYPEQIARWKRACEEANDWDRTRNDDLDKARRRDKVRIRELEREVTRKEKALAEAAAILILRKKLRGILEDAEA